jgi:hypothetical protein
MPAAEKIAAVERYLDRAFAGAFIHSRAGRMPEGKEAHTFRLETGRNTYVLSICREFIASEIGDVQAYMETHRVAEVLRLMGSGRLVLTSSGPRTQCAEVARTEAPRKGPGGRTAPLTADERERFLTALAEHGNVSYAAERGGKSRACFYHHRKHDPEFSRAWSEARSHLDGRENRITIRQRARRLARAAAAQSGDASTLARPVSAFSRRAS